MRILVDMDDVLENLTPAWVEYLNTKYGTNVSPDEITDWNMAQFFPTLTKEQVYGVLQEESLWMTVKPLPGAVECVKELIDAGHDVCVLTNSYYKTIRSKVELVLKVYFPFIKDDKLIVAANKQMIIGDILIDDAPHNLVGGMYEKILMDMPHNRWFNGKDDNVYRVNGWNGVMQAIQCIEIIRKCL